MSELRTPQLRVLNALRPKNPDSAPINWPIMGRAIIARRAGYTEVSGSVTRALNGIPEGSSSGDTHPGLIELGMVIPFVVDLDGVEEPNFQITLLGLQALEDYLRAGGSLPPVRNASICTNHRYMIEEEESLTEM